MKKSFLPFFAITFMIATSIQAQIPTNGLVAYYPFSGNANDSSGNGNNGTVNGATLMTDRFGKANSAYSFNGISWIEASSINFDTLNNFTSVAWVKTTNPNISQFILHKGCENPVNTNVSWRMYADGIYIVDNWNLDSIRGYITSTINIDTNWHMVALSYDNKDIRLYIDGNLNGVKIQSGALRQNNMPLYIGVKVDYSGNCNKNQFFNGSIDDIRIFNRALDSVEVLALYNAGGWGNPLPIKIATIAATSHLDAVEINWKTATELNTDHFIIQHSKNGNLFTDIGTVKAIGTGANSYEFTDNYPATSINYYRLQSIDKDGSSIYSKIVSVNFGDKQSFSIVPNPARDYATISFSKTVDKATIAVYDITGKAIITQSLSGSTNAYKLNTQTLTNGVYVIKVNTATGSYNEKLMINK